MRASMAYFAGAGTIVVAIAAGLGGGLTIANVLSPHKEKVEQTKLEQRMSAKPIPPSAEADQPNVQANKTPGNTQATIQADKAPADQPKAPVPYVAATQAATSTPVVVSPAPQNQNQPKPQTEAKAPQAAPQAAPQEPPKAAPQPVEPKVAKDEAKDEPAKPADPPSAKPAAAPREQTASKPSEQAASKPDDANAKARDADLKRLAAEKRKADRRQQWAERQKARQQRDTELRDVEASVRRDTGGPRVVVNQDDDSDGRGDFRRPVRSGFPVINLFGEDRD